MTMRGECGRCGKMVRLTLEAHPRLQRHRFAGAECSGSYQLPVDPETKFGAQHTREMREITEAICAERGLDPLVFNAEVFFEASRQYRERHKNDPTYRQRQEAAKARGEKWVAPAASPADKRLNRAELAYLIERLAGVNDPLGAAALAKLRDMLAATQ